MRFIVGIDEAGRGPLAGPVSVGTFAVKEENLAKMRRLFKGVKESKQLSAKKREEWAALIKKAEAAGLCEFRVLLKTAQQIDSKGIAACIRESIVEALAGLIPRRSRTHAKILLDGGLRAPAHFLHQKTIIKGDEKEMLIALASICAKVTRDRKMIAFARVHPGYGFEIHKGYGTTMHAKAIVAHGLSPLHRRSFTRRFQGQLTTPRTRSVAKKSRIG